MSAKFVLSNGMKAYVVAQRRKTLASAPARIKCPHCRAARAKKVFGVRTFRDAAGKPVRFAMQSFCTPCRNKKPVKKAEKAPKARKVAIANRPKPEEVAQTIAF